jgi:hypothetical protein
VTDFTQGKCWHCGSGSHPGQCPRIKAIEFFADGVVRRVEYHESPLVANTFDRATFIPMSPLSEDESKRLADVLATANVGPVVTEERG